MTPAYSIVLLAPVYVYECILAYKPVECYQIGALSAFKCLIYVIVYNLKHNHFAQLQVRSQEILCSRPRDIRQGRTCLQIDVKACYLLATM